MYKKIVNYLTLSWKKYRKKKEMQLYLISLILKNKKLSTFLQNNFYGKMQRNFFFFEQKKKDNDI